MASGRRSARAGRAEGRGTCLGVERGDLPGRYRADAARVRRFDRLDVRDFGKVRDFEQFLLGLGRLRLGHFVRCR
jgi:hypothetical protein